MRASRAIGIFLVVASACGEAELDNARVSRVPPATAASAAAPSVARLLLAEAEILARAGSGFQRRWLDWHFAGRPSQSSPFEPRTGGVDGYEANGFDPGRLSAADQKELERIRAAIARLPRESLRSRYQALVALHGNALVDTTRAGSLRVTDDGQHLVFIDADSEYGAHAWRIADGRRCTSARRQTPTAPCSLCRVTAAGSPSPIRGASQSAMARASAASPRCAASPAPA